MIIILMVCFVYFFVGCQKEEKKVVIKKCEDRMPTWSPDGKYIAFYRNPHDEIVSGEPQYQKLSSYVSVEANSSEDTLTGIRILNIETKEINFLVRGTEPDYSPGGKDIVYNQDGIWKINIETSATKKISDLPGQLPDWSPDGSKIACSIGAIIDGSDSSGIYIIDTTDNIKKIFNWAIEPNWHPEGNRLIFLGQSDDKCGICIGDTNGNVIRLVREMLTTKAHPEISYDGSKIVYGNLEDGYIHITDTLGENDIKLTTGWEPSLSADGKKIAFVRESENPYATSIWIMNDDGSGQEQITFPDN